ncbi:MAG: YvcK family protein [Candidatus Omnitrophica bacterium]|nr:YvcK family protein [Candidatus Omnitrophota bacterium]
MKNINFMVCSASSNFEFILEVKHLGAFDYVRKPFDKREFIAHFNALIQSKTRISCIGGGTGLFTLLIGLKQNPNVLLTSIVSMSDDGGSSGRLRSSMGILPPGDIRRSLVALSDAPELMNEIMQFRFLNGELRDHNLGNIFLAALTSIKGTMAGAVRALSEILNIQGIVLPVTNELTQLVARFEDGSIVKGESKIDLAEERSPDLRIVDLGHQPKPACNPDAFISIIFSDIVIIGPGDLFTSVISNLIIDDVSFAISQAKAKKVYICNLMTEPGETVNFGVGDHIREILKYLKGDYLDYVLLSNTTLSQKAIRKYAKQNQCPVKLRSLDEIKEITRAELIVSDVGDEHELVRHDSIKLKDEIYRLMKRIKTTIPEVNTQ